MVKTSNFLGFFASLDTQASQHPIFAFFCTFWCPKTQLRVEIFPKIFFFVFEIFSKTDLSSEDLGKNHKISGSRNRVLDPPRCSKVPNFAFNGLKSSKLALCRGKKKNSRVPFPGRQ